jgi:hypothetical protein
MTQFIPATPYTQLCFNPHGIKNYDAVSECEMRENGYASYDLTVLDFGAHYQAAHGAIIEPFIFKTVAQAQEWLIKWYEMNKQKAA